MVDKRQYFLCGVGGSGMLPLAAILAARGCGVAGSDRNLDQGRTAPKFDYLRSLGVGLHPQDGSGLTTRAQIFVASAAIEDTVPDVQAARALGCVRMTRAEALAELFNAAPAGIGVAGTSGKSTTTAMIAWILAATGRDPTVMNGAVMKNFAGPDAPFASARIGAGPAFVSEIDESDGSIALFRPRIAVINNIAEDHKTMDELRTLFTGFADRADRVVLNLDNDETRALRRGCAEKAATFGLVDPAADYRAEAIEPAPFSVRFRALGPGEAAAAIDLPVPGRHNVANALAALAACVETGVSFADAAQALGRFQGVKRRFELVGRTAGDVAVIDDFGHNPDKILATLRTLHDFPGRVLVLFQPHGFGPLRLLKDGFIEAFATGLHADDRLYMPEPVYYGGTADRSVSTPDIIAGVIARGRAALGFATREDCAAAILKDVRAGDRVIVMGARDDTLPQFAGSLLERIRAAPAARAAG